MVFTSRYDQFYPQTEEWIVIKSEGDSVISVECKVCHELVSTVNYNESKRLLTWTCSQGHFSTEENFTLD